jgi:OmpA-OmpF porin, OOP family
MPPLKALPTVLRLSPSLIALLACTLAALLFFLAATWAATVIETRSASAVRGALVDAGHAWADVHTDGLQVIVTGQAPTEAIRFRALAVAGTVVEASRVIDDMQVAASGDVKAPAFSVEILRNADGISLIGLVPAATDRAAIVSSLTGTADGGVVTDMLNTADHPAPAGWQSKLDFSVAALKILPRSKISLGPDKIAITAISDSLQEKARIESELRKRAPDGLVLDLDISAPRPVITPFTVRFLIDADGARFDACSADSDQARTSIIAAATAAGADGALSCTVGLGVPSPDWTDAVTLGIKAVADLGTGSVTFSDADVSLIAEATVDQAVFDRVVGELESNLPDVFSLKAVRAEAASAPGADAPPEFTATLAKDGNIQLRGRITDERMRDAVEGFARARFGTDAVYGAMRLDPALPDGWPLRVLAAIEALGELTEGSVLVRTDLVRVEGVSGSQGASDVVSRILSRQLGGAEEFKIAVRYDKTLDPLLGLPSPDECAADLNAIVTAAKIAFDPGSANISASAKGTLDKIAARMKDCADFPIEIGGHTDAQGRDQMNLQLSQDRAQAVVNALMDRRVLTGHLTAKGYGESVPVGDNKTEAGRESNRRIEFRLLTATTAAGTGVETGDSAAGGPLPDAGAAPVTVQTPGDATMHPKSRPAQP